MALFLRKKRGICSKYLKEVSKEKRGVAARLVGRALIGRFWKKLGKTPAWYGSLFTEKERYLQQVPQTSQQKKNGVSLFMGALPPYLLYSSLRQFVARYARQTAVRTQTDFCGHVRTLTDSSGDSQQSAKVLLHERHPHFLSDLSCLSDSAAPNVLR